MHWCIGAVLRVRLDANLDAGLGWVMPVRASDVEEHGLHRQNQTAGSFDPQM
jgi:hypothetical protein